MLSAHDGLYNNLAHNAITEIDADIIFMRHALAPGFENPKKDFLRTVQHNVILEAMDKNEQ